jgi:hypothetical protein
MNIRLRKILRNTARHRKKLLGGVSFIVKLYLFVQFIKQRKIIFACNPAPRTLSREWLLLIKLFFEVFINGFLMNW